MMILVPAFTTSILPPDGSFGGAMATSKNYANIDSVNINSIVVKYDHLMGNVFLYEVRGYFIDISDPFALSEASMVSIEYLNFTSSDSELLINGSEYSDGSFDATIYDGVTSPDLMIVPIENPLIVNFKQVFVVKFELPVMIYNATGQPTVDISLKITAFNNITDNKTSMDDKYTISYYLKTNLLINSEHFNKNNIIVAINDVQVDPYNFFIDSPIFDLKLYDMNGNLVYHDPARRWSSNMIVNFTSMKITNDYFSAVHANVAPVSVVDSLFYQTKISNYANRNDRPLEDGSFKFIEQSTTSLFASQRRYTPAEFFLPTDAGLTITQQTNVYDPSISMPYSTNVDTSTSEYPITAMIIDKNNIDIFMFWIYITNSTDQLVIATLTDTSSLSSLATGLYFPIGIINSTLYDIQSLFNESSMENCTMIATFSPNSWHHIAMITNSTNSSTDIYIDYSLVYSKTEITSTVSPGDAAFIMMNVTTMNSTGWSLVNIKNDSSSVNISYNIANIFVTDTYDASIWRKNGLSYISYINDTHFEWCAAEPESGIYRASGMYLNAKMYADYFSWTQNTIPMYDIMKFIDGYIEMSSEGYTMNLPVEIIERLDDHSRVMNISNNIIKFDFRAPNIDGVTWGDVLHTNFGIDENSTREVWVSHVKSSFSISSYNSGLQTIFLTMNETTINISIFNLIGGVTIFSQVINVDMSRWHHLRFDVVRQTGYTGNATLKFYLDGMLYVNIQMLVNCQFDMTRFESNGGNSACIDAFGIWRSSWLSSQIFKNSYAIGRNYEQIWPIYDYGDYTFNDAPLGADPTTVYSEFEKSFNGGLNGNITYTDKYHRNALEIFNRKYWDYVFSLAIPRVTANFVKLPYGYGYDIHGRVAFWFNVNSSYNASRFTFTVYDNGGTPYDNSDDTMHGFNIGNVFDDGTGESVINYYKENETDKIIKSSRQYLANDSWQYLLFEWNDTGNRLEINGQTIFYGSKIDFFDVGVTIEPNKGNMSLFSSFVGDGSAMTWFGVGITRGDTTDWINDPAYRTIFTMQSSPRIEYQYQASSVGANWSSSYGLMDSLTFEYETVTEHTYRPAMLTVPQVNSNFTTYSMLTRNYPTKSWNNLSLYYGGFYNLTFDINASIDSLPLQIVMDSSMYIIFTTQSIKHISILHPINVNIETTSLRVSIWSAYGNYTIGNIKITLTAKTPEFVDAFKRYVSDNAVYSKSIVAHGSVVTNISIGVYYLLATTYLADVAYFDKIIISSIDNDFYIIEPSLRQIVIEYTDQRGIHIDYNNFQTFRLVGDGYIIIPTNVFVAEIGVSVTLLSKNIFNEVVFFGSFTVTSISNYINIITIVHSLKVYNQQENFVYGVITKDYAPQFYWSEWVAPGEIINYRLTTGSYTVKIVDTFNNTLMYKYNLFGDDVLIVRSAYTLEQITNDIMNVNKTIGNQITNVAINITNQNSAINNSIVNVDINISNMNTTLGTQLVTMSADIISVNTTINQQTVYISNLLANINSTIISQNIGITSLIANINSTINDQTVLMVTYFTNINSTILQQSANMQQYLININNTVNSMSVNLSQAFFTDLMNNQTGELTGYISSTVNNQTTTITLQINNMTAYINNELINVNNNIYNQTVYLNGTFNFGFTEIMSTNTDIQNLIRKTDFSTLINWSDDIEVAGIILLTMMNSYGFPLLVELRRGTNQQNFTIYTENFVSVYVPGGLYKYRLRNLVTNTFVSRTENETISDAMIFKDFFVSNTSNYIETSFARIATPITPVQTGIDLANLIVVIVFIGVIIAVFAIVWWSRYKTPSNIGSVTSVSKSKKNDTGGKSARLSSKTSARGKVRKGFLP